MTTYRYVCAWCQEHRDEQFPMGKQPESVRCECGSLMWQHVSGGQGAFVKRGRGEYRYDRKMCVRNLGHVIGRSDEEQTRIYNEMVAEAKKQHDAAMAGGGFAGFGVAELVARVPLEAHEGFIESEGSDKNAWSADGDKGLKEKLQATGFWLAED